MEFGVGVGDRGLAGEFVEYLSREFSVGELRAARSFDLIDMSDEAYAFRRRLGRDGWLGLSWPVEFGGRGASVLQEWLVSEELAVRRLPLPGLSVTSLGPTLMRVGTEWQKRELLPGIREASSLICLGYTEPEAGTDLASLRTRAVRVDGGYVVDGQKIFTSGAHHATHVWTAVRTDPDAPKREGISILVIGMDADGVSVSPLTTQAGERTNQVFFDGVFVPEEMRVGEENEGWGIVRVALDFERTSLIPANALRRDWQELAALVGGDEEVVGELRVDVEIARLFFRRIGWLVEQGVVPHAEASMAKVWSSETRMRVSSAALDVLGPAGQLDRGSEGAPAGGDFAWLYRFSPVKIFGGGTNEVQRQLAARARLKGMGL